MSRDKREFIFDPSDTGENAPVANVIKLTSRKWTRVIIEHLLVHDNLRYAELSDAIEGISDKVLSDTLEDLEEYRLVDRTVTDDRPVRVEYSLTEAGTALETVIDAVSDWTDIYLDQIEKDST
ncbi:helix-turn-helix domain-containing protein (plasmid) [Haladaptatus sp. SPP-AMP-3]|uniref:winged helix-turn-helix transcriptional regulator n=1 Tax=Haladaptatus sp. SPP-AMP-3 TaxID=3121295 RepID=UPI003C2E4E1C